MKPLTVGFSAVALALAITSGGVMRAQGTPQPAQPAGSLAALTEEVHQLRLTLTESAKSQTQIQAMTVYLSAQQSRMVQIAARLDKLHAEVEIASNEARAINTRLNDTQAEIAKLTDAAVRANAVELVAAIRKALDAATDRETQARLRESEQLAALQTEEARWQDLIARLDAIVKR